MIKGVVFDWAGTTVDFGCFAPLNVFVDIFKEQGISITIDEARAPMGMSKKDHIRAILQMDRVEGLWKEKFDRSWTELDVNMLYNQFEPAMMKSLNQYTDVLDGVHKACDYLHKEGIRIGSTTGYTKEMMKIVEQSAAANGYQPEFVATSDDTGGLGRPHPDMIFKNMEHFNIDNPAHILKVGDTVADIKEGVHASVHTIGVIIGSSIMGLSREAYAKLDKDEAEKQCQRVEQIFLNAGADTTIRTMDELPMLINKINTERGES